jgi:hypothetical protein
MNFLGVPPKERKGKSWGADSWLPQQVLSYWLLRASSTRGLHCSTDVPPYQKEKMIFGGGLERFTGNM